MRCFAPDPAKGANSAPPGLLAGFWGVERKGETGQETEGQERVRGKENEKEVKGKKRGKQEKGTKGREGG